jgi:hypothetical protein
MGGHPGAGILATVGILPEQVVAEAVRASQHPSPDALLQESHNLAGWPVSRRGQKVYSELSIQDASHCQQTATVLGERLDAALQRLGYPGRDPVGIGSQPGQLMDEERVAAGAVHDSLDHVGGRLAAEHFGQQPAHLRRGEPDQRQHGGLAGQGGQLLGRRRLGAEVTVGADNKYGRGRQAPPDETEQLQRGRIGPMQIVEQEDQWFTGAPHGGGNVVIQLERLDGRRITRVGQQPRQGRPAIGRLTEQSFPPRPVARTAGPPTPPGDPGAALHVPGQLGQQRRLADPGLTGDQQQTAGSAQRLIGPPAHPRQDLSPAGLRHHPSVGERADSE